MLIPKSYSVKQVAAVLFLTLESLALMNLFSCTPAYIKPQQNDFFAPVEKINHGNPNPDSLLAVKTTNVGNIDNRLKDSLVVLYRNQNLRLIELNRQLNQFAKSEPGDSAWTAGSRDDEFLNRGSITDEILLQKIRNQNQQLNEMVEQLKNLTLKRSNDMGGKPVIVSPPSASQIPVLVTGATAVTAQPARLPQASVPPKSVPSLNYAKAIQLYQDRQYEKAISAFGQLLKQKIEPSLSDRYHFWTGVCYSHLNNGKQAIHEFKEVLGYRNSEKAEEAHFMIGQCYERMGEKKSARTAYETMLRLYPRGNLKQVAEKKLTLLK